MMHAIGVILLGVACAMMTHAAFDHDLRWSNAIRTGVLAGAFVGFAYAIVGCGGEAFTVADAVARIDAGASPDALSMSSSGDDDAAAFDGGRVLEHDQEEGGAVLEPDAGATMPPPAADGGSEDGEGFPPEPDAGKPPPPPALCCMTPCQGSAVAPITCGNGPAWTCAAGSCSDRACALGASCNWMGATCAGHVAVCP